ncbi:GNAT family N-acetyltransferase [Flammeovirga yaeyamensis]|uniref:GNAT family N-acetyltransferase n=1 Tax=Flammeovirga yaeyamensis TaxID=367791 RepID=A0AAX1N710_9BACT|nr:GNAT family N-acetyltransferase [Flammeovirga yaeyamensis]MBB3697882.1 ElaA protein [Flammeovirga yaeyamensis]NMF35763.1 GNAT family N-acetyltransferase [Flammeovirga yaeyamensis]QWG03285.1 GNAT family N-acetyltransferase [Flammeovirga yaeyamensis]
MTNLTIKPYQELDKEELYEILQLRAEVFVVEQDCVYNDLDNNDQEAYHLIARKNGKLAGYLRILPSGTRFKYPSIGRVIVHPSNRKEGIARKIMTTANQWIFDHWESDLIQISAQKYLTKFYQSLGYVIKSDEYLEDGIPHFKMELLR